MIYFVIVDMEEDTQTPLLLGIPFLNTAKAVIDVHEGMISFKIGEEKITFHVNRGLKYPSNEESIFRIDIVEDLVQNELQTTANERPLDSILGDRDSTLEADDIEPNSFSLRAINNPCEP
jgi:hypothetical protein